MRLSLLVLVLAPQSSSSSGIMCAWVVLKRSSWACFGRRSMHASAVRSRNQSPAPSGGSQLETSDMTLLTAGKRNESGLKVKMIRSQSEKMERRKGGLFTGLRARQRVREHRRMLHR